MHPICDHADSSTYNPQYLRIIFDDLAQISVEKADHLHLG